MKTEPYTKAKAARPINSRTDYFKVFFGPITHAIEQQVFNTRQKDGTPNFVKFIPVPDRRHVLRGMRRTGRSYYQTDYTAFEAGMMEDVMDYGVMVVYRYMLQNFPEVYELIHEVLTGMNRIHFGHFDLTCKARRMSGEMDTSLANGLQNLLNCLTVSRMCEVEETHVFEGDDGVIAVEGEYSPAAIEGFSKLGHILKIVQVRDPCEASFCGLIFADQGVIKDPIRLFAGFGWTTSFIYGGKQVMMSLLRAKSLSLAYEAGSCPLAWVLAQEGLKYTRGVRVTHRPESYNVVPSDEAKCIENVTEPSHDTRLLYEHLFGITVDQQLAAEDHIRQNGLLDADKLFLRFDKTLWESSHVVYG